MTNQNKNKAGKYQTNSNLDKFEIKSSTLETFTNIPNLYGMTLNQYIEGAEIHAKCFDQLKEINLLVEN
ncbi:hypothetical protein [Flavobacterium fluviale]|uniref:Uncharacterized protein n=1 Tax=Flavobacterium fluviale TaxID=2249356 RepID=A0A344LX53_9FLAO|nr:hypothetical protein [Flavobacterium fluviale]AXB58495.1 hypothetical protein HYN86_18630 [Flavobacterium fluviale]